MEKSKFLLILAFGFLGIQISAQNVNYYKAKFPKEDFIFLEHDIVIKFELENDSVVIQEDVYSKKIYLNEQAKQYEKESVDYPGYIKIDQIEAKIANEKKGKYKSKKIKEFETKDVISSSFFYDDSRVVNFVYPEMKEGSITELKTSKRYIQYFLMPRVFLVQYVPVEKFTVRIEIEKGVEVNLKGYNTDDAHAFDIEKKKDKTIYTLTQKDVNTLYSEPGGEPFLHRAPHYTLSLSKYTLNGKEHPVMGATEDQFNLYCSFIDSVNTEVEEDLVSLAKKITEPYESEIEQVEAIYNWVQSNIKYIAFEDNMGGFIPRNPQDIFEKRFGDCKDMTALIVGLLDAVQVDAKYAWVGTKRLPYKYSESCGSFIDNHMIAIYQEPGTRNYYCLDATNEHLPFGIVPSHIQGKEILIRLDRENYDIWETNPESCSVSSRDEIAQLSISENNLKGAFDLRFLGHERENYMRIFGAMTQEALEKRYQTYFAKGNNKSYISNIKVNTEDQKVAQTSFDVDIKDYMFVSGEEIFINMNLDKALEPLYIGENRKTDLLLDNRFSFTKSYTLEIPEDFQVKYIPEDFTYESEHGSAEIRYSVKNNALEYSYNFCINDLQIKTEEFETWNTFIKKNLKQYKENVVLAKK